MLSLPAMIAWLANRARLHVPWPGRIRRRRHRQRSSAGFNHVRGLTENRAEYDIERPSSAHGPNRSNAMAGWSTRTQSHPLRKSQLPFGRQNVVERPPSTGMMAPEMQEASSDARNETTAAISAGCPARPTGMRRPRRSRRVAPHGRPGCDDRGDLGGLPRTADRDATTVDIDRAKCGGLHLAHAVWSNRHRGVDEAGGDGVDANAEGGKFHCQRSGQLIEPALRDIARRGMWFDQTA
jgi:hypothetical protein